MQIGTFLDTLFAESAELPTDVRDILRFRHSEFGELAMIVTDILPDDSLRVWMRDALDGFEFDAPEARCVCPRGLPACAIHDSECGVWYRTTQEIPACGVIAYNMDTRSGTILSVSTYAGLDDTEPIETVRVQRSARGAHTPEELVGPENCNNPQRAMFGSGNYAQSAIAQYINSDAPAGQWWRPQTSFDRPPSYANRPGFLAGFDKSFLERIRKSEISCAANNVHEFGYNTGSYCYSLEAGMYLPSYTELTGRRNNYVMEGERWELIEERRDLMKVSHTNGSPVMYWTRSCDPGDSCYARAVSTGGYPYSRGWACSPTRALAAACVIKA